MRAYSKLSLRTKVYILQLKELNPDSKLMSLEKGPQASNETVAPA